MHGKDLLPLHLLTHLSLCRFFQNQTFYLASEANHSHFGAWRAPLLCLSLFYYCNPPNLCQTSTNTDSETQRLSKYGFELRTPIFFPKDLCGFGVTHQPTGWLSFPPHCRWGHRRAPGPGGCSHSRCRNEWLQKLQQGGEITAEPPAWRSGGSRGQRETGTNLARSNRTL